MIFKNYKLLTGLGGTVNIIPGKTIQKIM